MPTTARDDFLTSNVRLMWLLVNRAVPEPERDDVFQLLAVEVLKKHRLYDATRGKPGTFIGVVFRSVLGHRRQRMTTMSRRTPTLSMQAEEIDLADPKAPEPAAVLMAVEDVLAVLRDAEAGKEVKARRRPRARAG